MTHLFLYLRGIKTNWVVTFLIILVRHFDSQAQVLDYSTKTALSRGKITTNRSIIIQVNNKHERSLGEISIPHGDEGGFKILYAEIMDRNGHIVQKLKKKDILTRSRFSSGTFHQDELVSAFNLFWNEYPYTIRYAYENRFGNFIYLAYWRPPLYGHKTPLKSTLELVLPQDLEVMIKNQAKALFTEKIEEGKRLLKWELEETTLPEMENYSSSLTELSPSIIVAPENFYYGIAGSLSSWSHYGDWFLELNEDLFDLPDSDKIKIDGLIEDLSDKRTIISTLYRYLQEHTTYVNVSIDLGGLKSFPASYVSENKYGDCKALTTYMKALLNHAGIASNYVLVDLGEDGWIDQDIPGPQFNHIILGVPVAQDTIWLENTSSTSPFDYVGTPIHNRKALWLEKNKSRLINMPKISVDEALQITEHNFRLDAHGNGSVNTKFTFRAGDFEKFSYLYALSMRDDLKKGIMRKINYKDFVFKQWEFKKEYSDQKYAELFFEGMVSNQYTDLGDVTAIKPPKLDMPGFENPRERKTALQLKTPIHERVISRYDLSPLKPYTLELPEPVSIETEYGKYAHSYEINGHSVTLTELFVVNDAKYSLEQYPSFFEFVQSAREEQRKLTLILSPD